MFITSNRAFGWTRVIGFLLLASTLAPAQVEIASDTKELRSWEEGTLRAVIQDGREHGWRWSVQGPESPRHVLKQISPTEARFTAPPTRSTETFTVVLEDDRNPSIRTEFRIPVQPNPRLGCEDWYPGDSLVPGGFTARLAPLRGNPGASAGCPGQLPQASRICFCDESFGGGSQAMRRLNRCWIVAGKQGIQAFNLAGEQVPVPGIPEPDPGCLYAAVAVLPPGTGPCPAGTPRLVYSEALAQGPVAARVFALGIDGVRRELPLPETEQPAAVPVVRDLALDRAGNVFVVFDGDRAIWRIDLVGQITRHAWVPAGAPPEGPAPGILAITLDPATGDLYVGDQAGVQRVSPAGAVTTLLGGVPVQPSSRRRGRRSGAGTARPFRASHLALHGRELLILDDCRHELQAFHLHSRRLMTLLGGAGDHGRAPTRLGPIHALHPELPVDPCAVLGETGPLASNQEGLCLLAAGDGFAALELPRGPLTGVLDLPEAEGLARAPGPGPSSSAARPHSRKETSLSMAPARVPNRQANLERFRRIQLGIREYKKQQRLSRKHEAMEKQEEATLRAQLETLQRQHPAPRAPGRAGANPGLTRKGLFGMTLLGLGALSNPSVLGALAQNAYANGQTSYGISSFPDDHATQATAGLDQLGLVCADPLLAGKNIAPCADDYRSGVLAQMNGIQVQMDRLFVAPAALGAGQCLAGDSLDDAQARIALAQSDVLAEYDGLTADATALEYQLLRDGFVLESVGTGLLAGQAGALAAGEPATGFAAIPAFTLGIVGNGLIGGAFGIEGIGTTFGKASGLTVAYKAKYQRWANSQNQAILSHCTGVAPRPPSPVSAPSPGAGSASAPGAESPQPALADALQKLSAGCALSEQHDLDLPVCSPESLAEFSARNGTIALLHKNIACLSSGLLMGKQAPCPDTPLADARTRSDTFAYFSEFYGEVFAAAYDAFTFANGLFVGSEGLVIAGNAAMMSGNASAAAALVAGGQGLAAIGDGLFADGYDLLRIGALSQRWVADVTLAFNAHSRTHLDANRSRASGTGAGTGPSASMTGGPGPGEASAMAGNATPSPVADPPAATASESGPGGGPAATGIEVPVPAPAPLEPSVSAATRALPLGFLPF